VGIFASPFDAARSAVRIERRFEPNPRLAEFYEDLYSAYRETYRGLKPVFSSLSKIHAAHGVE